MPFNGAGFMSFNIRPGPAKKRPSPSFAQVDAERWGDAFRRDVAGRNPHRSGALGVLGAAEVDHRQRAIAARTAGAVIGTGVQGLLLWPSAAHARGGRHGRSIAGHVAG